MLYMVCFHPFIFPHLPAAIASRSLRSDPLFHLKHNTLHHTVQQELLFWSAYRKEWRIFGNPSASRLTMPAIAHGMCIRQRQTVYFAWLRGSLRWPETTTPSNTNVTMIRNAPSSCHWGPSRSMCNKPSITQNKSAVTNDGNNNSQIFFIFASPPVIWRADACHATQRKQNLTDPQSSGNDPSFYDHALFQHPDSI